MSGDTRAMAPSWICRETLEQWLREQWRRDGYVERHSSNGFESNGAETYMSGDTRTMAPSWICRRDLEEALRSLGRKDLREAESARCTGAIEMGLNCCLCGGIHKILGRTRGHVLAGDVFTAWRTNLAMRCGTTEPKECISSREGWRGS